MKTSTVLLLSVLCVILAVSITPVSAGGSAVVGEKARAKAKKGTGAGKGAGPVKGEGTGTTKVVDIGPDRGPTKYIPLSAGLQGNGTKRLGARSLLQACRKEAAALCGQASTSLSRCLTENVNKIQSEVCKRWVTSRFACKNDGLNAGKCTKDDTTTQCMKKMDPSDISEACKDSHYFRAFQMYMRWNRRRRRNRS